MKKSVFFSLVIFLFCASSVFAGFLDQSARYFVDDNGVLAKNKWVLVDTNKNGAEEWYYFGNDYKMLANTKTPDGYEVNAYGQWVVGGVVQEQNKQEVKSEAIGNSSKTATIDTSNTNLTTSADKKKELKSNISNKSGVDFVDTITINGKHWVNAIKMSYNDSYIKANSGNYNTLKFEVGIKDFKDTCNYQLSIFVNGEEYETLEDFQKEPDELEFNFDPNSEIMITYSCSSESYASSDSKNLYIRNAVFSNSKD